MLRRLRSERGQTAAEWLGVLVLIAALVLAFSQTPVGTSIGQQIRATICKIAGGSCQPEDGNYEAGIPPLSECVRDSGKRGLEGSVKFTVIKAGGKVAGVKEVRADGTVRVTFEGNAELGLDVGAKGGEVSVGKTDGGAGGDISVSGNLGGSLGWKFDNEADADKFIKDVQKKAIAILDPTWNLPGTSDDADIKLPDPDYKTVQGGVQGTLSGKLGGAGLEGNLSGTGGITFDDLTGNKTVFLEVGAGGSVDAAGLLGADGSGKGRLAVTFDKNGDPITARFTGTLEGNYTNLGLDTTKLKEASSLTELSDAAKRNKVAGSDKNGGRLIFDANLAVDKENHPENYDALIGVLKGQGLGPLVQRYDEDGVLNVKTYTVDSDKYGGGLDIGVAGVEGYYTTEDAEIQNAWYRAKPSGDWVTWEECVKGMAK